MRLFPNHSVHRSSVTRAVYLNNKYVFHISRTRGGAVGRCPRRHQIRIYILFVYLFLLTLSREQLHRTTSTANRLMVDAGAYRKPERLPSSISYPTSFPFGQPQTWIRYPASSSRHAQNWLKPTSRRTHEYSCRTYWLVGFAKFAPGRFIFPRQASSPVVFISAAVFMGNLAIESGVRNLRARPPCVFDIGWKWISMLLDFIALVFAYLIYVVDFIAGFFFTFFFIGMLSVWCIHYWCSTHEIYFGTWLNGSK